MMSNKFSLAFIALLIGACATAPSKKKGKSVVTEHDVADFRDDDDDAESFAKVGKKGTADEEELLKEDDFSFTNDETVSGEIAEGAAEDEEENPVESDATVYEPVALMPTPAPSAKTAAPMAVAATPPALEAPLAKQPAGTTVPQEFTKSGAPRVWYIKSAYAAVRTKPVTSSPTLRQLKVGETILGERHGNWVKVKEAEWIASEALSETPIGRTKTNKRWQDSKAKRPSH